MKPKRIDTRRVPEVVPRRMPAEFDPIATGTELSTGVASAPVRPHNAGALFLSGRFRLDAAAIDALSDHVRIAALAFQG
jgi:hypothetical protein